MKILLFLMFPLIALASEWPQWSGDTLNHHDLTPKDPLISKENVKDLSEKWEYTAHGSVLETPTVKDGMAYFTDESRPDFGGLFTGGSLYAVNTLTGKLLWSKKIRQYTKSGTRNQSRSSPAIAGDKLIIGDSINNAKFILRSYTTFRCLPGTSVMAIDRHTGKLLWKTIVEPHFASRITMSPIVHGNQVLVGVSSIESQIPAYRKTYKCCTFKGSLVSLDLDSGKILWKSKMITEDASENSGAAVWGNSPPIDVKRGRIYVGTGNNYQSTEAMFACYLEEKIRNVLNENQIAEKCAKLTDSPNNRFDSIVAVDLKTGAIIWSKKSKIYDAWNWGCGTEFRSFPPRNGICPEPEGMDADFAQAPMFISTIMNGSPLDILAVGQKDGKFWAISAEDGSTLWTKQLGPAGKFGGHQWGSATDGKKIFFQITNLEHHEITLEAGAEQGRKIQGGYWGAVDVATGKLLWQTADPSTKFPLRGEGINHFLYGKNLGRGFFAAAMGPITYYNGLLFTGSLSGEMLAMDAETGKILWSKMNKGSIVSAPSIVDDQLFWGSGYHAGFAGKKVYSFGLK